MCIIQLHSACLLNTCTVRVNKSIQFRIAPQDLPCTIHICSLREPFKQRMVRYINTTLLSFLQVVCVCPYSQPNPSFLHSSGHFPPSVATFCNPIHSYLNRHPAARFPNQITQSTQMCHCASQVYGESSPGKLGESSFRKKYFHTLTFSIT